MAGLIVAETEAQEELEDEMRPLAQIFTPFFAFTGAQLDLGSLADPTILALVIALVVLGVITKAVGGVAGSWSIGRWGATTVGFGMVPRGEVGIVVANLGLATGLLTGSLFSAVLVAVIATTIVAPYLLAFSIPKAIAEDEDRGRAGSISRNPWRRPPDDARRRPRRPSSAPATPGRAAARRWHRPPARRPGDGRSGSCRAAGQERTERGHQASLGHGVEVGGRLVEDQDRGVPDDCPRDRQAPRSPPLRRMPFSPIRVS